MKHLNPVKKVIKLLSPNISYKRKLLSEYIILYRSRLSSKKNVIRRSEINPGYRFK